MANRHFGKIGDVWKHLPLAEILKLEAPNHYWESNAGSAQYPLSHSPERDYGVYYFLQKATNSTLLSQTSYFQLLSELTNQSEPSYPGSPLIAFRQLPEPGKQFLFCDIDSDSLTNIEAVAQAHQIPDDLIECHQADGISTLLDRMARMFQYKPAEVFVNIDPCGGFVDGNYIFDHPFERHSHSRPSPLDCFMRMSKKGFKTMFWFGFQSSEEQTFYHDQIRNFLINNHINELQLHLWCGEIRLAQLDQPGFTADPGVRGCAVLCANLADQTLNRLTELGRALAGIYRSARIDDQSGALIFSVVTFNSSEGC